MRNTIAYFAMLAVFLCLALIVADVYEVAGDLDRHPVFRWVMAVTYGIVMLSFLGLLAGIVWQGLRRERRGD